MIRFAAVLVLAVLVLPACSTDPALPRGPSSGPGATSGPAVRGTTGAGGASGRVEILALFRPVCGPEPRSPATPAGASDCPEEPVVGVEVTATKADGSVAGRGTTADDGTVALDLAAGTYTLTAAPADPPRITPPPATVTVGTEPVPTVILVYESSMQ
ncbi:hypothetical protein [Humibacillus xanthopallidus]|uniref:hypothetical protein n=1 Tax=Humibacillus xanthopallidus TaxID=412689 RepID=UPI0038506506